MLQKRIACVDVPALALQWVIRRQPLWRRDPLVVVQDDKPTSHIVWSNRPARLVGIERGMKFMQAQALTACLRAVVVAPEEIQEASRQIFLGLLDYSPRVEPEATWPGLFWLDPNGLLRLYDSLMRWTQAVHGWLQQQGYGAAVVVGFERYGVLAIARTTPGASVLDDPHEEKQRAARVRLARLNLSTKLVQDMALLGIETLGDLLRLPAADLRQRYGAEAWRLHTLATGKCWTPLQPEVPQEPIRWVLPD
ncbi:MAG: hypothetical protein R3C68_08960 [Myxococcota bacterium]